MPKLPVLPAYFPGYPKKFVPGDVIHITVDDVDFALEVGKTLYLESPTDFFEAIISGRIELIHSTIYPTIFHRFFKLGAEVVGKRYVINPQEDDD
jgi:hypothetical protein